MADVFRTLVVTAAKNVTARGLYKDLFTANGDMFVVPLSATGSVPATHYISSGYIDPEFAAMIPLHRLDENKHSYDSVKIMKVVSDKKLAHTIQDFTKVFDVSDISEEDPYTVMERLGLKKVG